MSIETVSPARASLLVEWRRYTRTKILVGLMAAFVLCGLGAPPLALYMSDLIASAGVDQIVVTDREVTAADSAAMFTQNVGQIAVLVVMGVAVTGLSWDARAGSSTFYRVRMRRLAAVAVPRLVLCCAVSIAALAVSIVLWAISTSVSIGAVDVASTMRMAVGLSAYVIFAAAVGFVLMAALRRVAAALGVGVGIVLFLPLIAPITRLDEALPTALVNAHLLTSGELAVPIALTLALSAAMVMGAVATLHRHTLRRES